MSNVARGLSAEQMKARENKLTASSVACLMRGDVEKIMNLWRELVGDPAFVAEDLSAVWPVQLGSHTESLNLEWYERKTGRVLTRRGEVVVHPSVPWAACTLDGWDARIKAPVECKHVGGREQFDTIVERYQPQMQWTMGCTAAAVTMFSVIEGSNEPRVEEIPLDAAYSAELMQRAEAFMECVRTLTPPVTLAPVAAPIIPVKVVDMQGNNAWSAHAASWLATREAAAENKTAEKELKALAPADAKRTHGHGIEITRNKAGAASLREQKS